MCPKPQPLQPSSIYPPSMVLSHATAATAGLKSGCVPLDPLVSLVLGSGTETEVKPWA